MLIPPRLKPAFDRLQEAEMELTSTIRRVLPEGEKCYYMHGDYEVGPVRVLDHADSRILVASDTDKEYWIGAYRVTRTLRS